MSEALFLYLDYIVARCLSKPNNVHARRTIWIYSFAAMWAEFFDDFILLPLPCLDLALVDAHPSFPLLHRFAS